MISFTLSASGSPGKLDICSALLSQLWILDYEQLLPQAEGLSAKPVFREAEFHVRAEQPAIGDGNGPSVVTGLACPEHVAHRGRHVLQRLGHRLVWPQDHVALEE